MIRFLFKDSIPKRIASSFAIVILVGSFLLNLPISQIATSKASYFDHLFTTVSMVCVTGLSTQPVAETYNTFGQVICMILMPWFIYKIYPPEIKATPEAPAMAQKELDKLGPITKSEIYVALIFVACIILWATAIWTKLHPTAVALIGVLACVVTGSLTWDDILGEKTAWDILIWMGTLVGMAGLLGKLGVVAVFADFVSNFLKGYDWFWASFFVSAAFVYSQYFFASGTARITALFSAFAAILVAMGAPIPFTILLFGLMNSPGCTLTHYSSGVTPIFFGVGYVPQGTWWRVGALAWLFRL